MTHLKNIMGDMTMDKYLATFLSLSRYIPELVPTEEKKTRKLQRDIGGRMVSVKHTRMDDVILATPPLINLHRPKCKEMINHGLKN